MFANGVCYLLILKKYKNFTKRSELLKANLVAKNIFSPNVSPNEHRSPMDIESVPTFNDLNRLILNRNDSYFCYTRPTGATEGRAHGQDVISDLP